MNETIIPQTDDTNTHGQPVPPRKRVRKPAEPRHWTVALWRLHACNEGRFFCQHFDTPEEAWRAFDDYGEGYELSNWMEWWIYRSELYYKDLPAKKQTKAAKDRWRKIRELFDETPTCDQIRELIPTAPKLIVSGRGHDAPLSEFRLVSKDALDKEHFDTIKLVERAKGRMKLLKEQKDAAKEASEKESNQEGPETAIQDHQADTQGDQSVEEGDRGSEPQGVVPPDNGGNN